MSGNEALVLPMCETLSLLLNECKNRDEETRVLLILQTRSFFKEVLELTNRDSSFVDDVIENIQLLFRLVNESVMLFVKDKATEESFAALFSLFLDNSASVPCEQELSAFVLSFLFSDAAAAPSHGHMFNAIASFIENPVFCPFFEALGGLFSLWDLLQSPTKDELCTIVFSAIPRTMRCYFQSSDVSQMSSFLLHAIKTIKDVPETRALQAFQLLFDLIANAQVDMLTLFLKSGGLASINEYVITQDNPQLLVCYQMFMVVVQVRAKGTEMLVLVPHMTHVIQHENSSDAVKCSALAVLTAMLKQFEGGESPLQAHHLFALGLGLGNTTASKYIELCYYMATHFHMDLSAVIPALSKLFTKELAIESNVAPLFGIFRLLGMAFRPFAAICYETVTVDASEVDFGEIANRYSDFLVFLPMAFQEAPSTVKVLASLFLRALPLINDRAQCVYALSQIIVSRSIASLFIDEFMGMADRKEHESAKCMLSIITEAISLSRELPIVLIELGIVGIVKRIVEDGGLDATLVLNMFTELAGGRFDVDFDANVASFMKSMDYMGCDEETMRKLVFGIQGEGSMRRLCFPSLLHKCGQFELESEFDVWLCGQYGIDTWLSETGKSITEFPGITRIARRYMLPAHLPLMFNAPKLVAEICDSTSGLIPLFEFVKNSLGAEMQIPASSSAKSLSFWLSVGDVPPMPQIICTCEAVVISVHKHNLEVNDTQLCEFQLNTWYLITITSPEKGKGNVFVGTEVHREIRATAPSTGNTAIVFGGVQKNAINWYIGGAVRVFDRPVGKEKIQALVAAGPANTFSHEAYVVKPSMFVKLFSGLAPCGSATLSENVRPVISFPLSRHLTIALGGSEKIFGDILDMVMHHKLEDARYLLHAICNLQHQKMTLWPMETFVLHMSALLHTAQDLIDVETLDKIIDTIARAGDVAAFVIFLMDFGLFDANLRPRTLPLLQRSINHIQGVGTSCIATFLFEVFHVIDLSAEEQGLICTLFANMKIDVGTISRMIASLSGFSEVINVPSLSYTPSSDSPLFFQLQTMLDESVDGRFRYNHIFYVLPPNNAVYLVYKVVNSALAAGTLAGLDQRFIMRVLVRHCSIQMAWSCALSLLTGVVCDATAMGDVRCASLNSSILPEFLVMVSIVTIVTSGADVPFWSGFVEQVIRFLTNNIDKIDMTTMPSSDMVFAITQLISFGFFDPSTAIYPYAPDMTVVDDVFACAIRAGQQFPQNEAKKCPFPNFGLASEDDEMSKVAYSALSLSIPETIDVLPVRRVPSPFKGSIAELCDMAIAYNNSDEWNDWPAFIRSVCAAFESGRESVDHKNVMGSSIFSQVLHFVVRLLVKHVRASSDQDLLSHVLLLNTAICHTYSTKMTMKMIEMLIEELTRQRVFSATVIQFVCGRVREGWFGSSLLSILGLMLSLVDVTEETPPQTLTELLIESFTLVAPEERESLSGFFSAYSRVIFSKGNIERPEFCVLLVETVIMYYNILPRAVSETITRFCACIDASEELKTRWAKVVLVAYPDCDLKLVSSGLLVLANGGPEKYRDWSTKNVLFDMDFARLRTKERLQFVANRDEKLRESLTRISNTRIELSSSFFANANAFMSRMHIDLTVSKAVCACVRDFQRESLLARLSYFMRIRERLLTRRYKPVLPAHDMVAVTLLSDPLLPSRRLEKSPLIYKVPTFPGNSNSGLEPDLGQIEFGTRIPQKLQSLLAMPYLTLRTFVVRAKHTESFAFSQSVPTADPVTLGLLELLLNGGRKFESILPVSLLYGIDPLPGLFMQTEDRFIFLPGMKLTASGVCWEHIDLPEAMRIFYFGYFAAGYFGVCTLLGGYPVIEWPVCEAIRWSPHYWMQRPTAVQVTFVSGWNVILIAKAADTRKFQSIWKRAVDDALAKLPKPSIMLSPLASAHLLRRKDATKQWTDGLIDTFTYLCLLNTQASRSTADFTQYYVFPWIVGDYNSLSLNAAPMESFRDLNLPMGQIGSERGARFRETCEQAEQGYFYGTHYMHLGVIIYFLIRLDPFCLFSMHIHRGWDHPNRIFCDVYETWMAAGYTSPADVRELIPEIFCVPECLSNVGKLPLTTTVEGKDIADVNIGNWCKNAYDFVHKMQYFLQSDGISGTLPRWIDLIFGCKSRGEAAFEAANLFHPMCYVQTADEDSMDSPDVVEREAAAARVINFGQCCLQLFKTPHANPGRLYRLQHLMTKPELVVHQKLHPVGIKFPVSDIRIQKGTIMSTTGIALFLPPFFASEVVLDQSRQYIYVTGTKARAIVESLSIDSTSAIGLSNDGVFMSVGQMEGGASIYRLSYANSQVAHASMIGQFQTVGPVSRVAISSAHFIAVAVSGKTIERFDIGTRRPVEPIKSSFDVNCIAFDNHAAHIIAGGYSSIAVWNVSGTLLLESAVDASTTCIAVAELPIFTDKRFFVTSHANGFVRFWSIDYATMTLVNLRSVRVCHTIVKYVVIDKKSHRVLVVTQDSLYSIDYIGSPAKNIKPMYAIECSNCGVSFDTPQAVRGCRNCHRFFCPECLPKEQLFQNPLSGQMKQKYKCPQCMSIEDGPAHPA